MLGWRVLVTVLGAPVVLACLWWGGWATVALVEAVAVVGTWEFSRLTGVRGMRAALPLAAAVLLPPAVAVLGEPALPGALALYLAALAGRQVLRGQPGDPSELPLGLFGFVYVPWLVSLFILLRARPDGLFWILFALLVTWAYDMAGYFCGRYLGRHRLVPGISPGKTVEGLVAGLIVAPFVALGLARWSLLGGPAVGTGVALGLGLLTAVVAQLGDLTESLLKRQFHVKDSGGLLPGHGGVLDRVDSWVFAVALVYFLVR